MGFRNFRWVGFATELTDPGSNSELQAETKPGPARRPLFVRWKSEDQQAESESVGGAS